MIHSKKLYGFFLMAMSVVGILVGAAGSRADEPKGIDGDPPDETPTCEVAFDPGSSVERPEREVEFRCLMDDAEWARYREYPDAHPERCAPSSPPAEPLVLTAAAGMPEPPLTLEIIYKSDTQVQIVRPDGTKITVDVPKGEIVNKTVQKHSPTLDREIGREVRELKNSAKAAGKKYRWLLKGGFKFGFAGLISLAAAAGPAFAEAVIPDTCAALRDPDRGDSCKEVINWVANAQDALFEKSCEACDGASLNKFPTKAAELCRAAEIQPPTTALCSECYPIWEGSVAGGRAVICCGRTTAPYPSLE